MTAHPNADPKWTLLLAAERWEQDMCEATLHALAQAAVAWARHTRSTPLERARRHRREYMRKRREREGRVKRLLKDPRVLVAVEQALREDEPRGEEAL